MGEAWVIGESLQGWLHALACFQVFALGWHSASVGRWLCLCVLAQPLGLVSPDPYVACCQCQHAQQNPGVAFQFHLFAIPFMRQVFIVPGTCL